MNANTLVVIPAFNEEASITRSIEALIASNPGIHFIVVNDGSTDSTAKICKELGYPCVSLCTNLGLAGAFRTGMKYASRNGYSYVVQYDADGQHDPSYITDLVETAYSTSSDIVIGSRFIDKTKSFSARMAGSSLIKWIIKLTTGKTIHDPTSGMRLYGPQVIEIFSEGFDITPEPDTLALLMRSGMKVTEVPVIMHERMAGKSYLTFSKSLSYMLRICLAILFANWYRSYK